jgi:nicotinate dehydrogenase subunit A
VAKYTLTVNGKRQQVDSWDPQQPLLYVLRNQLDLHGPKFGCGAGQCGSCTVLIDDQAARSCAVTIKDAAGKRVTTLEGLGTPEKPHPVQAAFIAEQAAQCGYCIPGMIMRAQALLQRNGTPTEAQIRLHMNPNLCRCGTHSRILRAVGRAARRMKGGA